MKKIFCFINGYGPNRTLETVALSEDGKIMNWCFSKDEESAQREIMDRSKYSGKYVLIWVYDKSKDVGYQRALKKHEEVNYAK